MDGIATGAISAIGEAAQATAGVGEATVASLQTTAEIGSSAVESGASIVATPLRSSLGANGPKIADKLTMQAVEEGTDQAFADLAATDLSEELSSSEEDTAPEESSMGKIIPFPKKYVTNADQTELDNDKNKVRGNVLPINQQAAEELLAQQSSDEITTVEEEKPDVEEQNKEHDLQEGQEVLLSKSEAKREEIQSEKEAQRAKVMEFMQNHPEMTDALAPLLDLSKEELEEKIREIQDLIKKKKNSLLEALLLILVGILGVVEEADTLAA